MCGLECVLGIKELFTLRFLVHFLDGFLKRPTEFPCIFLHMVEQDLVSIH